MVRHAWLLLMYAPGNLYNFPDLICYMQKLPYQSGGWAAESAKIKTTAWYWPLTFHLLILLWIGPPMAVSKPPSVLPVHGHVQHQGAAAGRLGTFTGSSQEIYKKQSSAAVSSKSVTRWRPSAFDFKSGSSTICPTCQGTGHIPKGAHLRRVRESDSGANSLLKPYVVIHDSSAL